MSPCSLTATAPGNHDHFGIIPSRSHVAETHPLYDRGMYRRDRGPDYYSFTYGGVHFVALNTLMRDDSAYYGDGRRIRRGSH